MNELFIKHFPEARYPWKLYLKDGDKGLVIEGSRYYRDAKTNLEYYKSYTLDALHNCHNHLLLSSADPNYVVITIKGREQCRTSTTGQ